MNPILTHTPIDNKGIPAQGGGGRKGDPCNPNTSPALRWPRAVITDFGNLADLGSRGVLALPDLERVRHSFDWVAVGGSPAPITPLDALRTLSFSDWAVIAFCSFIIVGLIVAGSVVLP